MGRPYIKFCCPTYDVRTWDESLAKACYFEMIKEPISFDCTYVLQQGTIIEECRNRMINPDKEQQAKYQKVPGDWSHFLFMDSDIGFTYKDVEKLLAQDKDIISGAYRPKHDPDHFVCGSCTEDGIITSTSCFMDIGLQQVSWAGGGFLLVKKSALDKMTYPYFWKQVRYKGNRAICVGEDVYFCLNAREQLLDVWVDFDVRLNHESNRYQKETNESLQNQTIIAGQGC